MSVRKGTIALMGSGELTATMVEVHKELLAGLADSPRAVFLDTPAGFQLNVDQLSARAVEFFHRHVQQEMAVASFKSKEASLPYEAERTLQQLRQADFMLIGPGSPTYAVRQWQNTSIPEILTKRVEVGGCLVAASAAALTVGRFTLPVYEIYKVGEALHWVEGINILERFGFNLVVVPHWNNAEGGTHDTRCCFMGESRFRKLESLLPEDAFIFGLDEHTACLIDLEKEEAVIKGLGTVRLRHGGEEIVFEKGDRFPLDVLRGKDRGRTWEKTAPESVSLEHSPGRGEHSFWHRIHGIQDAFRRGLETHQPEEATNALLELDRTVWQAKQDSENEEFISQARELLRDLIVLLGMKLESSPKGTADCLAPLVEDLLGLREKLRRNRQWQEADGLRDALESAGVIIEDTEDGPRWRFRP